MLLLVKGYGLYFPYSLLCLGMRANNTKLALPVGQFLMTCLLCILVFSFLSIQWIREAGCNDPVNYSSSSKISPLATRFVGPVKNRPVMVSFSCSTSTVSVPPGISTWTCLAADQAPLVRTVTTLPVPVPRPG